MPSSLFPTRRSSDLCSAPDACCCRCADGWPRATPEPPPSCSAGLTTRCARRAPAKEANWWFEPPRRCATSRSEEHTSELQSPDHLVCLLLLEKKKT